MNRTDIEFLKQLQDELFTQPTDGNADPRIWGIGVEDRIYGMESEASDGYVIVNDGETVLENCSEQELIRYLAETHEINPDSFSPYDSVEDILETASEELNKWPIYISYYKTIHTVAEGPVFLTKKAAQEHIRKYGYNYSKPHTFVMTADRCPEYKKLLRILKDTDWETLEVSE